ncbi:DNA alkylation repair protein [Streptomyces sp. SID5785]|uniref:DNA alkylation repair protein n=1 Tax=Streptomyces sp. SID5785 TaxID=2690309 RepID=UPI00136154C9|nr:DNA alkylation repair protein [Streptomyces sp. SID5785]MZD07404.1 DNA alkylation repair protein [Streptomyces sp. SID5785]
MSVSVPPPSALADTLLARLPVVFGAAADPERAVTMRRYMKDVAPFLGLAQPVRKERTREVLAGTPRPDAHDLTAVALRCWELPEREYAYFAIDYLRRYRTRLTSAFLPVARHLITSRAWWDTVDLLAVHTVGGLVAADPALTADMDRWIGSDDIWLARTALLHQLRRKETTDTGRLFAYCLRRAGDQEFFLRKAIGWSLREYARTDPDAVRAFVADHRDVLAPLSVREALRGPAR